MAITVKRILIDEAGTARVFYYRDDGPAGSALVELKDTAELKAITLMLQNEIGKRVVARSTPEGREAARAEREARRARLR